MRVARSWGVAGALALSLGLAPDASRAAVFPCDEPGVLAAIAAGGGPHTFSCAGPTTIVTSAELVISQSVELDGGGLLTLSGGGTHRVFYIGSGSDIVTLRNLAAIDGVAPESQPGSQGSGGCIAALSELTLVNVEISGCEASNGGGVYADYTVTAVDSRIHDNRANYGGGGIYANHVTLVRSSIRNNRASPRGGGIFASYSGGSISESTIAGNTAPIGAGIMSFGYTLNGLLSISGSTISHNTGGSGLVVEGGQTEIENSTFAANVPLAIHVHQFPHPDSDENNVRIRSSTLVGNPSAIEVDPALPPAPGQGGHYYASLEDSIVSGASSGHITGLGGNVYGSAAALNLGKLGPHGGPTWTIPLRAPSVAIDAAVGCPPPSIDQRGVARPQGAACDAGAFEYDGPAPGQVPALPFLGVAALAAALVAAGWRALRAHRPA